VALYTSRKNTLFLFPKQNTAFSVDLKEVDAQGYSLSDIQNK